MNKGNTNEYKDILDSIMNQRTYLVNSGSSGKNNSLCLKFIKEIRAQIDAYQSKWDDLGWTAFIRRNLNKIDYLIPNNPGGETTRLKVKQLIQIK